MPKQAGGVASGKKKVRPGFQHPGLTLTPIFPLSFLERQSGRDLDLSIRIFSIVDMGQPTTSTHSGNEATRSPNEAAGSQLKRRRRRSPGHSWAAYTEKVLGPVSSVGPSGELIDKRPWGLIADVHVGFLQQLNSCRTRAVRR